MRVATILPFHFLMLTLFGVWCPPNWPPLLKSLRKLYLLLVILATHVLVILQLARLVLVRMSFDEFNDTFYVVIATFAACFKLDCNLAHYDELLRLIDMFQEASCLARDDNESRLKRRYDDTCGIVGKASILFVEVAVLVFVIVPLNGGIESRRLPYEIYQIYSLATPLVYWLSYAHHVFAAVLNGGLNMICDTLITGFLLQLCGQIDLVAHRLTNLPMEARRICCHPDEASKIIVETTLLKENVRHHVHIYKYNAIGALKTRSSCDKKRFFRSSPFIFIFIIMFAYRLGYRIAETIVRAFNGIIVVQFYLSTLQICMSVYQLTTRVTNAVEMFSMGLFLVCMFVPLGVYCYFGNELSLKSISLSDAIFNIDWTPLTVSTKRNLAFMILRSSKPIEISDGAFVRLSMETFASIVKTSYTAFNVLKSS